MNRSPSSLIDIATLMTAFCPFLHYRITIDTYLLSETYLFLFLWKFRSLICSVGFNIIIYLINDFISILLRHLFIIFRRNLRNFFKIRNKFSTISNWSSYLILQIPIESISNNNIISIFKFKLYIKFNRND